MSPMLYQADLGLIPRNYLILLVSSQVIPDAIGGDFLSFVGCCETDRLDLEKAIISSCAHLQCSLNLLSTLLR